MDAITVSYAAERKSLMAQMQALDQRAMLYACQLSREGHKQEYIASLMGCPQGTVSRWLKRAAGSEWRDKRIKYA